MRVGFSARGWIFFIVLLSAASPSFAAQNQYLSRTESVPGEILIRLREDAASATKRPGMISQMLSTFELNSVLDVRTLQTDSRMQVVKVAQTADMNAALARLKSIPSVEIAEPNFVIHAYDDGIPNDPSFNKSWGMRNIGQAEPSGVAGLPGVDIGILPLWQKGITGSSKIIVAVIDTGIDWTHPDLAANLYTNLAEVNGAPDQDNDGNGFVHDVHGWNFAANNNDSRDEHGHGTHCAGTIGASGNNGIGIAGINWNVSLMPVRFLDAQGNGNAAGAIEAINYARMMKVNVMSNSWGGGAYSDNLKKAIQDARNAGIVFVAAAGNDGTNNDSDPSYPASYDMDNVIAVAATDHYDNLADFSNYGSRIVHVGAPGVDIYSTTKAGGYEVMSGTSMACPFVAGTAALLLSQEPTLTPAQVKDRIIRTSVPVKSLTHKVMSRGRVNAYNAINNVVPKSPAPDESAWITVPQTIESEHPYYLNNQGTNYVAHVDGAKMIRVHFEKIDLEPKFGRLALEGQVGEIDSFMNSVTDYTSDYAEGDTMTIRLFSYVESTGYGFKIDKVQYIPK